MKSLVLAALLFAGAPAFASDHAEKPHKECVCGKKDCKADERHECGTHIKDPKGHEECSCGHDEHGDAHGKDHKKGH